MFRIAAVARMVGVRPEVIRAWERRYGLVSPARTDSRYRQYDIADVEVLRAAKRLVDAGHSIGDVARRGREAVLAAAQELTDADGARADGSGHEGSATARAAAASTVDDAALIARGVAAVTDFDREALEQVLRGPQGRLAPIEFCRRVLLPLLQAIGQAWHDGHITVAAEHFGSALVRARLIGLLHTLPHRPDARRIVCACPAGERHEAALLTVALAAAIAGYEVIYLGADTPDAEIVATARATGARVVALSWTIGPDPARARALSNALAALGTGGWSGRIVMGGAAAQACRDVLTAVGAGPAVEIVDDVVFDLGAG